VALAITGLLLLNAQTIRLHIQRFTAWVNGSALNKMHESRNPWPVKWTDKAIELETAQAKNALANEEPEKGSQSKWWYVWFWIIYCIMEMPAEHIALAVQTLIYRANGREPLVNNFSLITNCLKGLIFVLPFMFVWFITTFFRKTSVWARFFWKSFRISFEYVRGTSQLSAMKRKTASATTIQHSTESTTERAQNETLEVAVNSEVDGPEVAEVATPIEVNDEQGERQEVEENSEPEEVKQQKKQKSLAEKKKKEGKKKLAQEKAEKDLLELAKKRADTKRKELDQLLRMLVESTPTSKLRKQLKKMANGDDSSESSCDSEDSTDNNDGKRENLIRKLLTRFKGNSKGSIMNDEENGDVIAER